MEELAEPPDLPLPPDDLRPPVEIFSEPEMIELPGGTFLMGSPDSDDLADDEEKPQYEVILSVVRVPASDTSTTDRRMPASSPIPGS
jgi:hypothetical protein